MLPSYSIEPAKPAHVSAMSDALRAGDAAEIEAAGFRPGQALWRSYRGSLFARTGFVGGQIAAMWGMGGCPLGSIGRPWLLTAPPVENIKVSFVRVGRAEIGLMLAICPELRGYVDARYHRAIRFLEVLGFSVGEPFPLGAQRAPFREYRMKRG